jgi:hypothetical protein
LEKWRAQEEERHKGSLTPQKINKPEADPSLIDRLIRRDEEDVEDCSLTVEEKEPADPSKNNSFARREQIIVPPVKPT